jgi:hypothetical protein
MRFLRAAIRPSYQILLAFAIMIALGTQFIYGFALAPHAFVYIEQFFSYFTIVSNLFVAGVFGIEAWHTFKREQTSHSFDAARGAAIFFILTTGLVYNLFLRGPHGEGQIAYSIAWVNDILHYIVPVAAVLDWLIFPPLKRLNWSTIFSWVGLTIIYLALVEIGGYFSGVYPYIFLDPTRFNGYVGVLRAGAAFLPFFTVFSVLVMGTAAIQRPIRMQFSKKRA